MAGHPSLSIELRKTLPAVEMSDDITDQFVEILHRPRTLYRLLSQTLKLADGELFLTLPASPKAVFTNLKHGCSVSRGQSMEMLGNICLRYTQIPHHTALLDNGMQRPADRLLVEYQHQYQVLTVENDAYYCLDRIEVPEDEIKDFIMQGTCGYYSIGVLANCSMRKDAAKSVDLACLIRFVQCAEAVIFSIFDSEAFAIWCPKS